MSSAPPMPYELFALRYASRAGSRGEFFLGEPNNQTPMGLDYYVWLARRPGHVCLIDTGFNEASAKRRGRELLRNPIESLQLLGTQAHEVQDVVLTHFHYDHAGNAGLLPNARFHMQEREMQFTTGSYMAEKTFSLSYDVQDITRLVEQVFAGRVQFHEGDGAVSDGITLHHVGGHTMGLQFARVFTRRGWVLLASDASHFYEGFLCCAPFSHVYHVGEMVRGYRKLRTMAESDDHVIPGHDPAVMQRYSAPGPDLQGIAVRLDEAPHDPMAPSITTKETI